MYRLIWLLYIIVGSCSTKTKKKELDIQITIKNAHSYKYNLSNQTYIVSRILKPDTTIYFNLSAQEREKIIKEYYDLGLDNIKGRLKIEDNCMIVPKLNRTLNVKSKTGLQEISFHEGCNNFKQGFAEKGNKIVSFVKFVDKIINEKSEIKVAPNSDYMYL